MHFDPKTRLATALSLSLLAGLAPALGTTERDDDFALTVPADRRVRVMNTVPRFRLKDQNGEPFGIKALEGKVWIATFIFTRCEATCPGQTAALRALQDDLADHPSADQIQLVSFSVDPSHDSPEALAAYAEAAGADPERWSFLTGEEEELLELCRSGFLLPVNEAADGQPITHSQSFVLVDRGRRVRGHYDALNEDAIQRLKADLETVLVDPPGPPTSIRRDYYDYANPGPVVHVPRESGDVDWLEERAEAQRRTLPRFEVVHDFSFADRQGESGITFVNRFVDDAGRDYKGVHYDHGNGVSIADVDGDGRSDIYFVTQLGSNELYRNLGGGKFENITAAAGVGVADRVSVTASFADVDNDGDPDLYVSTVKQGNLLFENDGKGGFTDISEASGLDHVGHCSSAVFFDYDRDGLLDLFQTVVGVYTSDEVGRGGYFVGLEDAFQGQTKPKRYRRSILYRNEGENRFVDVSKQTGLIDKGWTGSATPIDLNQDGWQDLYVLSMQGHDEYWENQEGKRFVKRGREVFPRTPWGSMGVKSMDFENDGLMDLFITDMHIDMVDDVLTSRRYWYAEKMKMTDTFPAPILRTDGKHVLGNAFFKATGNGRMREVSDRIGAENYWPWGLSTGDLNADGFEDAFVTSSMNYPFRYAVNSVLLNNRGQEFLDSEFILGVEPRRDGRTSTFWYSLDCDGADAGHPACGERKGEIDIWGALGSRSSVIFDLDQDGDLDIVTNDFGTEPMVLISDLTERHPDLKHLSIELVGADSNRSGLGAKVQVKAGLQTLTKVHDGLSGYMSQSDAPLYFGLGKLEAADRVTVTWPSGKVTELEGPIEANQLLTIDER